MAMFSYLLTFLAVLFWLFRLVVAFTFSMDMNIGFVPINMTWELVVLFVSIPCLIMIFKRNLIFAGIYLAIHIAYFGKGLFDILSGGSIGSSNMLNIIVLLFGIIIPLFTFLDILVNRDRKGSGGKSKTSWFYDNEEYERKLDERADKNNYKF